MAPALVVEKNKRLPGAAQKDLFFPRGAVVVALPLAL